MDGKCNDCGWDGCISCNDYVCPQCGEEVQKKDTIPVNDWCNDVYKATMKPNE